MPFLPFKGHNSLTCKFFVQTFFSVFLTYPAIRKLQQYKIPYGGRGGGVTVAPILISTDSFLLDRKDADTVMTGICVGLKSTLIFLINTIPCCIISGVEAFS